MMAVVRDRFIEMVVDCGLGTVVLVVVLYALLTMFRRNRQDGESRNGPPDQW